MAILTKSFPEGIYPNQYPAPLPFEDFMPSIGEILDSSGMGDADPVLTSTALSFNLENGIRVKFIGIGFSINQSERELTGTVTSLEIRTPSGALMNKLTGFTSSLDDFMAAFSRFRGLDFDKWLMRGNDTVNGSAGHDDIFGYAGNDTLNGGDGDDFFEGGAGKDTYNGGAGGDQVSFADSYGDPNVSRGVKFDAVARTVLDPYGNTETFTSIESFRGSQFADTFKGSSANEEFMGLGGNDMIDGGGGFDVVRYHRDYKFDGLEGVIVNLQTGVAFDGFDRKDTLISIEGVRGTNYADTLTGSTVSNALRGDGGNDKLFGKGGNDDLFGGAGKDTFYFDTTPNSSSNLDKINDFSVADDTIRIENAVFTKIVGTGAMTSGQFHSSTAGVAHDTSDRVIYDTDSGVLYYDADGNGGGARVAFAKIQAGLDLTASDFFIY